MDKEQQDRLGDIFKGLDLIAKEYPKAASFYLRAVDYYIQGLDGLGMLSGEERLAANIRLQDIEDLLNPRSEMIKELAKDIEENGLSEPIQVK